jgi:hypothetical protein
MMSANNRKLFVAVATGQNIANLPPILEYGQPSDYVIWLETLRARKEEWAKRSRKMLRNFGFREGVPAVVDVEDVNDPFLVVDALQDVVSWCLDMQLQPVLVCNGGNKLTPLGLLRAFESLRPVLLYGDDQPAVLWRFEQGLEQRAVREPYHKAALSLRNILKINGYIMHDEKEACCVWQVGKEQVDLPRRDYGHDLEKTAALHDIVYQKIDLLSPVSFSDIQGTGLDSEIEKWKRNVQPFLNNQNGYHQQMFISLWNATVNLLGRLYIEQGKPLDVDSLRYGLVEYTFPERILEKWKQDIEREVNHRATCEEIYAAVFERTAAIILSLPAGGLGDYGPIGKEFEYLVAYRVGKWAADRQGAECIYQVWKGVKVAKESDPDRVVAEFDVLLVLRNAILLHLECKTSSLGGEKDVLARIYNLQRTGSRLARMAVCGPLWTQFANKPWFPQQHRLRCEVEKFSDLRYLPMTLPQQPNSYTFYNEHGIEERHECPAFEDALEDWLWPYLPSGGTACTPVLV